MTRQRIHIHAHRSVDVPPTETAATRLFQTLIDRVQRLLVQIDRDLGRKP